MATAATEILPLADAVVQLRVDVDLDEAPRSDETQIIVDQVTGCIESAVEYCAGHANLPLLDVTETYRLRRPLTNCPAILPAANVKTITSIAYWRTSQNLREPPSGSVMVGPSDPLADDETGRIVEVGPTTHVWPPAAGWPNVLTDSLLEFTVVRGFEDDDDGNPAIPNLAGIKKAVALATWLQFEGDTRLATLQRVHDLLTPFGRPEHRL